MQERKREEATWWWREMTIRPLRDHVLVKVDEKHTVTKGGIVIPEKAAHKSVTGTVIAAGPGEVQKDGTHKPMSVKEGDWIAFSKNAGEKVPGGDERVMMITEADIVGIFKLQ